MNDEDITSLIPLNDENNKLVNEILEEKEIDKLKNLTQLFNLNQAKKNAIRVLKLNSLLDMVSDQMIERFQQHPDNFSNSDLLNYLQVTQSAIDRANKSLNLVEDTPAIVVNQVNIDSTPQFDRESRDRITQAVAAILQKSKEMNIELNEEEPILVETEKEDISTNIENVLNDEEG